MFEHHRKSPWFAEKYDPAPEFQALRTRVRKVGWRGRMDAFVMDLESGKFDPDLSDLVAETVSKENADGESGATNGVKAVNLRERRKLQPRQPAMMICSSTWKLRRTGVRTRRVPL